jgi:hypothetical protein
MSIDPATVKWPTITAEGDALIEAAAALQYNDIARKYGAKLVHLPNSTFTPKDRPDTRY